MEVNATLLLQLAMLLLLLAWLSTFLFSPFLKIYDERERRIEGAAEEAGQLRSGAAEKAGLVDARMREAQEEARQLLAGLREKGIAKERDIVESARASAQANIEVARSEIAASSTEIRDQLRADARGLADDIVQKILQRAA